MKMTLLALTLLVLAPGVALGDDALPEPLVDSPLLPWLRPLPPKAVPLKAATYEEQVMEIVNQERWNNGQLPPLKQNDLLDTSSELHSFNMADRNFFAHCDVDTKKSPFTRMTDAGYLWSSAGENVAAGYSTPSAVMTGWMGSSGHRANILSTSYNELGIGHYYQSNDQGNIRYDQNGDCTADSFNHGPFYHYWTQNFGRRSSVYPVVINREAYRTTICNVSLYVYGSGWAVDMRIKNGNGAFTAWQPFATDVPWTLGEPAGTATVTVEIRSGGMSVLTASDTIESATSCSTAEIFADGFESGDVSRWSSAVGYVP